LFLLLQWNYGRFAKWPPFSARGLFFSSENADIRSPLKKSNKAKGRSTALHEPGVPKAGPCIFPFACSFFLRKTLLGFDEKN
jgi:hypothetical protein